MCLISGCKMQDAALLLIRRNTTKSTLLMGTDATDSADLVDLDHQRLTLKDTPSEN